MGFSEGQPVQNILKHKVVLTDAVICNVDIDHWYKSDSLMTEYEFIPLLAMLGNDYDTADRHLYVLRETQG